MVNVPFSPATWKRGLAKEAFILLKNRFFEQNPVLTNEGASLIARPGLKAYKSVGDGPIKGIYSQPGSFNDDLFVVSGTTWYRVGVNGSVVALQTGVASGKAFVSMAGTGDIGETPAYMFLADGDALYVYDGSTVEVVATPDNFGTISVAHISSNVVVVPAQGQGVNGRFYWIEPGSKTIDPLNFATAEQAPDPIYGVVAFGDQFWLPGQSTTEVWYFTGDADFPVSRLQGVAFNRGTWSGTATQVKESMVITDSGGGVFQVAGGLQRISNPAVEERIRKAMQIQIEET